MTFLKSTCIFRLPDGIKTNDIQRLTIASTCLRRIRKINEKKSIHIISILNNIGNKPIYKTFNVFMLVDLCSYQIFKQVTNAG